MYDNMDPNDFPGMEKPGQKSVRVLTTLSLIGCGIQFISLFFAFFGAKMSYDMTRAQAESYSGAEASGFYKAIMGDPKDMVEVARLSLENRIPIVILGLVSLGLCFYGVLQMRKMKREGFNYYVIGELLPLLTSGIFIGTSSMKGIPFFIGLIIPVVFITLYAVRRKYMV